MRNTKSYNSNVNLNSKKLLNAAIAPNVSKLVTEIDTILKSIIFNIRKHCIAYSVSGLFDIICAHKSFYKTHYILGLNEK